MLAKSVDWIERTAGFFLLAVASLTFVMVILRKFFDTGIPDGYDFSRLLQAMAILWGIACASYCGAQIVVDLVWDLSSPKNKKRIDFLGNLGLLLFMLAFAALATQAAVEMRGNNLLTSDLRIPQWGFYFVGALGISGVVGYGLYSGWGPGFAAGTIAAGGTIGIMIPPSVIFTLYGIMTETNIAKLLFAGVLPGLLAIFMYSVTIQIIGLWRPDWMPRAAP